MRADAYSNRDLQQMKLYRNDSKNRYLPSRYQSVESHYPQSFELFVFFVIYYHIFVTIRQEENCKLLRK